MLKLIIINELHKNILSFRFQISALIIVLLFSLISVQHINSWKEESEIYRKQTNEIFERIRSKAESSISDLATEDIEFIQKIRKNFFISDCSEKQLPTRFKYNAFFVKDFSNNKSINNPYLSRGQKLDWTFILTFIISFIVLLFTFDAISGDKEDFILRLVFSNSVSRSSILLGKYIAAIISVVIILLTGILLYLLVLITTNTLVLDINLIYEILGFFIIAILYISCLAAFGLLFSTFAEKTNISLLYVLAYWIFITVIIPNSTLFIAQKVFPIESTKQVEVIINQLRDQELKNAPKEVKMVNFMDLSFPAHKISAEFYTKLSNKEMNIKDAHFQKMFNQLERTRLYTILSPSSQFSYACEGLLGGGYLRFRKNWEHLHIYQVQFFDFFKKIDAKDPQSPHWYNPVAPISTSRKPVSFEEIPIFQEKNIQLSMRIRYLLFPLSIIILTIILALTVCFWRFLRYDLR